MITCPKLIRIVAYQFARKLKNPKDTINAMSNGQQSMIPSSFHEKNIKPTAQELKELSEQFQSLSEAKINVFKQKQKQKIIKQLAYQGQDPSPNKLVNRPAKGVVWGLGGQLVLAERKVQLQGVRDDPDQISKFLQLHQVKNIYIHDWRNTEQKNVNRKRYSIIGSCFSARHCWKTAIELKNAFNKHMLHKKRNKNNRIDAITALMIGRKDDQWAIVEYKDFEVSLMTEEQRQAVDLQWKWNNPVDEDVVQKHSRLDRDKKRRKGQFQDFD